MTQLSTDNQVDECNLQKRPRWRNWQLFVILLLSVLVSHAPRVYGRFAFVEGGVSKNNVIVFVVLPFLSLILMVASVVAVRRFMRGSAPFTITWLGEKKRSDILGVVVLSIIVLAVNAIMRYVFKRLHIPMKDLAIVSITTPGIALLAVHTLRIMLVTPIVEEIFWRGYIQDVLQGMFYRPIAVVAQAVLFALVHMVGLVGRLPIFFLGLMLGIWRCQKRSLVPLILVHMVVNTLYCVGFWRDHLELRMVRITHDYRAPLEELCKPPDYDPNENALPHYARAFELLVEKPKELDEADLKAWPIYLSPDKMSLLRNWTSSNQQAAAEFEAGTQKPYYCRQYSEEPFDDVMLPPLSKAKQMVLVVLFRSQMSAIEGDLRQSVSDILTCYRFGQSLAGPKTLVEQLMGLGVKKRSMEVAFRILKRVRVDDTYLRELQFGLEEVSDKGVAPIDFSGERLICHELIQRHFTDDGTGGGHIPRISIERMRNPPLYLIQLGVSPIGEDQALGWEKLERKQTTRLTDWFFRSYLDSVKDRTPAEQHRTRRTVEDIIRQAAKENAFLQELIPGYEKAYHMSYRCKAFRDALIVTVAILRYRLEQAHLPDELYELVRAGYLDSLPNDPYSDTPFIYRKLGSDFLLYSLGPDFDDDGGTRSIGKGDMAEGDDVFWPPEEITSPMK